MLSGSMPNNWLLSTQSQFRCGCCSGYHFILVKQAVFHGLQEEAEKPEKDAEIGVEDGKGEDGKGNAEVHVSFKPDESDDDLFNCLGSYKSEL